MSDNSASTNNNNNTTTPSIARPGAPPGKRRTKFMIEQENERILDYIRGGATDRQIMKWVGLTHRNYRKRIYQLQKQDMEQTLAEQSTEARAFTFQRIVEKIHNLEIKANQIMQSRTNSDHDKLEAMKFLLQLHEDEYSLKEFGPSRFLNNDHALPGAYQQKAMEYRAAFRRDPSQESSSEFGCESEPTDSETLS